MGESHRLISFLLVILAMTAGAASAADNSAAGSVRETPVVSVVRDNAEAVVNISTERIVLLRQIPFWGSYGNDFDLFCEDFFTAAAGRQALKLKSVGSGVILDKNGLIVTNAHVVNMASDIIVVLMDGTSVEGQIVYQNPDEELALIKIKPPKPLKPALLGQTQDLMIGETAVAIGDPLGLENSVSCGIVSGKNRKFYLPDGEVMFDGLIQTDAPINPGNSGGALLNLDGELIGINMAVVQNYQDIGFAIPAEKIKKALDAYRRGESGGKALTTKPDSLIQEDFFATSDVHIQPDAKGYTVQMDVAGLNKDKVKVDIRKGLITISGERSSVREEKEAGRAFRAESFGSFTKSVSLPEDADPKSAVSKIEGDMLIVHFSKRTK